MNDMCQCISTFSSRLPKSQTDLFPMSTVTNGPLLNIYRAEDLSGFLHNHDSCHGVFAYLTSLGVIFILPEAIPARPRPENLTYTILVHTTAYK
jgi:hypothetical protein